MSPSESPLPLALRVGSPEADATCRGSARLGVDAGYLARMVTEHRIDDAEALETAADLVSDRPRAVPPTTRSSV